MATVLIFQLAVLIFSVIIHEISHGYVAEYLGDPTARLAGRLTMNPIKHLDFFGSFLLPVMLWFLTGGAFVFGWAKPVPYNPYNLKNPLSGAGKIAAAGPLSNLAIAVVFGIILRILSAAGLASEFLSVFLGLIVYLNILLAVFNLVPLPPLDGSKVLFAFLPRTESSLKSTFFLERYGMILVLLFIFFGFQLIIPIIDALFKLIAGQAITF
jgi:Zn-dependent protease